MNIVENTNNAECIKIIGKICPAWLEELPLAASHPTPNGQSRVVHQTAYNPVKKTGVLVFYFGYGCDVSDRGWSVIIFEDLSLQLFDQHSKLCIDALAEYMTTPQGPVAS